MNGCIYKLKDGRCDKPGRYLSPCIGEACASQTPSNYDQLISYTPEELANVLSWLNDSKTADEWLLWLKAPAEKDGKE